MQNKNNIFELPLYFPSPIITYLHYANTLSMALVNDNARELFYSFYIQMSFNKNCEDKIKIFPNIFAYYNNIIFDSIQITEHNLLKNDIGIIDQMINWIKKENYVVCYLADHLIPNTYHFTNNIQAVHPFLFYGYDKKEKIFFSIDFDERRHLNKLNVRYNDVLRSIKSEDAKYILSEPPYNKENGISYELWLFRIKNNLNYKFNIKVMKNEIENFLNSYNSSLLYPLLCPIEENSLWGMDIQKGIIDYLETLDDKMDIRIFHCIFEMITLWQDRIDFLKNKGFLKNDLCIKNFGVLKQKSYLLRMLSLKHENYFKRDISFNSEKIIIEMIALLKEIFLSKQEILLKLLDEL